MRVAYSPNPASDFIYLKPETSDHNESAKPESYSYKLYDKQGIVRKQGKSNEKAEARIDVRDVPADNYFLHLIYPDQTVKNQVIIKH